MLFQVIDILFSFFCQVDFMFSSSKQVSSLKKLLTSYSSFSNRQTIFASASIPQHRHFLHDCIQQKWTKVCICSSFLLSPICDAIQPLISVRTFPLFIWQNDVMHIHVNPMQPMPSCLLHRFVVRNFMVLLDVIIPMDLAGQIISLILTILMYLAQILSFA